MVIMPSSITTLVTVSFLASAALVSAAPTMDKSLARKVGNAHDMAMRSAMTERKRRRSKRSVIYDEAADDEGDQMENQLAGLSNDQLELLAEIVQNQMENYRPEMEPEAYEIVQIPKEFLMNEIINQVAGDDSDGEQMDGYNYEAFPRDRRGYQMMPEPEMTFDDQQEEPEEMVLVPEDALEEALLANQQDEMELRMRIAEISQILNERATRGL